MKRADEFDARRRAAGQPTHLRVRAFVAESWAGQYVTNRHHATPGYVETWATRLHGPTGPLVFTGVRADGTLVDLSRETGLELVETPWPHQDIR